jgi:hypothetical protein
MIFVRFNRRSFNMQRELIGHQWWLQPQLKPWGFAVITFDRSRRLLLIAAPPVLICRRNCMMLWLARSPRAWFVRIRCVALSQFKGERVSYVPT